MRMTDLPMINEVKTEYVEHRSEGKSRAEATASVLANYAQELTLGGADDGLQVWIGLADGMYSRKELTEEVAQKALVALDALEQCVIPIAKSDLQRRRSHYAQAPMPERKAGKPRPKFRCQWAIGDTFAYQLSGPYAQEMGVTGRYMLLRKVAEKEFTKGTLYPVVTLTLWDDTPLPTDAKSFQKLPMLQLCRGRGMLPEEACEYRVLFLIDNNQQLKNAQLQFVGNFPIVQMPDDEVIFENSACMSLMMLRFMDRDCCMYLKVHRHYCEQQGTK